MSRTLVIARRELLAAAVSPVTWLILLVAWSLATVVGFFFVLIPSTGEISLFIWFMARSWLWMQLLVIPILSMRLLSEEKRTGTLEALMTAPVSDHEVVLGKFLAVSVIHFGASLILPLSTLPFMIYGKPPDFGQLLAAFATAIGIGTTFLAVGVFASSLTSAQVLAAFVAMLIEAALLFGPVVVPSYLPPEHLVAQAVARGDLFEQVHAGALGILDLNHVTYQLVIAALFLLFAVRSLEVRKWR